MKGLFLISLSVLFLFAGASCSTEQVLSFSLFATHDLRRNSEQSESSEKIEKWYRFAEEYMDMKIEIDEEILTSDNVERSCEEYIRRNDLADVFLLVDSGGEHLAELAKQGKIINLLDYKDYMPNYSKMLEQNLNYEITNIDGGIYGFATSMYYPAPVFQYSWLYNYTVFQENGLSIPQNMEELYQTAKRLKQLYPDSYPIMFYSTDIEYICNCFGFLNRLYLMADYNGSEYQVGLFEQSEEWKNTIAYMNRLYEEELIAPNFDAYKSSQVEYNAANARTFIIPNAWSGQAGLLGASEGYEWVCGNTPRGFDDQEPFYSAEIQGYTLSNSWNLCISAEAENPELLVKLIDHDYSQEAIDLYNWGEKGVHYDVDENGKKYLIPQTAEEYERLWQENPTMELLRRNQNLEFIMVRNKLLSPVPTVFNGVYEKTDYWMFSQKYITSENAFPGRSVTTSFVQSSLTEEQNDTISENMAPLHSYVLQELRRFITGERSLDEWDAFIEKAKQLGDYQSAVNIYNDQLKKLH